MAKDQFSFDIVSEVDLQEVRNAVDQAAREISQRFDFKGTGTSVSLENEKIEMAAGTEDRLKAAWQVLQEKAVKRQVPLKSLQPGQVEQAAKGTVRQTVDVIQGIPDEKAKQISKFVRSSVPKTQTQIQGSQVRVSAKAFIDGVIGALLLKLLWRRWREGDLSARALEDAAFTIFLYGRMAGCAAEIDDHTNRGRNMDTRTPASECRFVS